jgi:hypothetical protein
MKSQMELYLVVDFLLKIWVEESWKAIELSLSTFQLQP